MAPSTIHERLRKVLSHVNISQAAFAESLGIGQPHMSTILSDKHQRKPSKRVLRSVSEKYGINYEWLINGDGDVVFEEKQPAAASAETDPPELQQVIQEARSIWDGLEMDERYELAAMLLKDIARKKKEQAMQNGEKGNLPHLNRSR